MARKPKQKPQPEVAKNLDEPSPFDTEGGDDDVPAIEIEDTAVDAKSRDWRDVEKFKELRELRKLVDDDVDLD